MKKVLAFVAGAAAVTAVVWYFASKKKQETMLVSQEFDEDEPIAEEVPEDVK